MLYLERQILNLRINYKSNKSALSRGVFHFHRLAGENIADVAGTIINVAGTIVIVYPTMLRVRQTIGIVA